MPSINNRHYYWWKASIQPRLLFSRAGFPFHQFIMSTNSFCKGYLANGGLHTLAYHLCIHEKRRGFHQLAFRSTSLNGVFMWLSQRPVELIQQKKAIPNNYKKNIHNIITWHGFCIQFDCFTAFNLWSCLR